MKDLPSIFVVLSHIATEFSDWEYGFIPSSHHTVGISYAVEGYGIHLNTNGTTVEVKGFAGPETFARGWSVDVADPTYLTKIRAHVSAIIKERRQEEKEWKERAAQRFGR